MHPHPPLGTGLSIEEKIRLRWTPVERADAVGDTGRNEKILQAINFLEEGHRSERGDEEPEIHQELTRLDLKLNLLLELVGELVGRGQRQPEWTAAELGATLLRWQTDTPPSAGEAICLELFLSELFPVPIAFAAEVEQVEAVADGASQVTVRFLSLSTETTDALEKLIFRRHRRQVASARHSS